MNLTKIINKSTLYLKKSAPIILTCLSVAGVVGTAILASKAGAKSSVIINIDKKIRKKYDEPEQTKVDKIKLAWKCYISTTIVGASSIACIFGTYAITKQQQAVLLSAYIFADNALKEYRRKVKEVYGEDADTNVRDALVQEKYNDYDFKVSDEKKLYFEHYYGKFFERTKEEVFFACYYLNRNLALVGDQTLNNFYDFLDLPNTPQGDLLGWSIYAEATYGYKWIDFNHKNIILEDGLECIVIEFPFEPHSDYLDCC